MHRYAVLLNPVDSPTQRRIADQISDSHLNWKILEIDKAGADAQYDPLGALYNLLEHDTAHAFVDEFADVPIDASQVI